MSYYSRWFALCSTFSFLGSFGCLGNTEYHNAVWSPDGLHAAFIEINDFTSLPLPDSGIVRQVVYVNRYSPDNFESVKKTFIESVQRVTNGNYSLRSSNTHLKFSPDSRHLLVVSPRHLTCINLHSGSKWRLNKSGEHVDSAAWMSKNVVGFAAYPYAQRDADKIDVRFWRQEITSPQSSRVLLHQESRTRAAEEYQTYHSASHFIWDGKYSWSPDGNKIIFRPSSGASWAYLNISKGEPIKFGKRALYTSNVIWKPDSSGVVCLSADHDGRNFRALFYDTTSCGIHEFTTPLREVLINPSEKATATEILEDITTLHYRKILWTSDGQYLVVNSFGYNRFGCLIRPIPWECIYVKDRVQGLLPEGKKARAWVSRLGVPGWLQIRTHDDTYYAVDYDFTTIRQLEKPKSLISPNGRYYLIQKFKNERYVLNRFEQPFTPYESHHQEIQFGDKP